MAIIKINSGRNKGQYRVRYQPIDPITGKKTSIPSVVCSTRKEAREAEKKMVADYQAGKYKHWDLLSQTLSGAFESYVKEEAQLGRWEEPTLKDWNYTLRLVKEYFNNTKLVDIDQKAMQRFARNYVQEHSTTVTKDSTVSRRLQHLRQFFKSLQDKGLEVNPVPERALSKFFRRDEFTVKREKKTFTADEIVRLEDQIYKELSRARVNFVGSRLAILIALQTGMRPQEIQALRWDCLITEDKYHVFEIDDAWSEKYHHFNGHLKSRPRGDKRRTLPIDERLYETLMEFKGKQAVLLSNNGIVNKGNLILLNLKDYRLCAEGYPIGQQNMNVKLKELCKKVNIDSKETINMYTCRHSVASRLANTPGMSYPWAAARMGHTVDMFLKTYVHAMQDQTSDMLNLIGK